MNTNNYLVIMAGGIGSRFWPMSTAEKPKQFLDVLGTGKPLLQQTVHRFRNIVPAENIYIVTSANYQELVLEQIPGLTAGQVLLEPCMRNTAPCIAYAAWKINQQNPEANIVVAPSDHLITDETQFEQVIQTGLNFTAANDTLLTLGMKPHRPETGYGYIQANEERNELSIHPVKAFKEKPNRETAQQYLAEGSYYWNSGIFIWSVQSIMNAIRSYLPEIAEIFEQGKNIFYTGKEQAFINQNFPACPKISVDYGIMEKADNIFVLPADFGWSDLGTWGSLWEKRDRNSDGNTVVGSGVHLFECSDTIVHVPNERPMVLQGLDGYIVVEANGVLLVCKKEEEQRIKDFRESVITKTSVQ
ncbi:mannose-1-phosphate guanylyltransferase [Prolixibacter bellariivorans]|uniref:mannose-1-phosphate guanylyltransferase n=1 Tax=Prolixibacter bellariivorans TaxID=314319 RepID=A0A5M4B1H8_9BACT|nr:mannose-1-phosphate guanylyltransferase [Prolixibacter bellariivorans]GET33746.1 mannose-1-phosphate guanylyltransferase [Prolixibacter bellariivorans]